VDESSTIRMHVTGALHMHPSTVGCSVPIGARSGVLEARGGLGPRGYGSSAVVQHDLERGGVGDRRLVRQIVGVEKRHHAAAALDGSDVGLAWSARAEQHGEATIGEHAPEELGLRLEG
jgi:hypothetical protein